MTPDELRDRTRKFAVDLTRFCRSLPHDSRTQEIAAQLVDAATGADFVNRLAIAIDCADESLYWLDVLIESETADTASARIHRREAEELTKILVASRATARRNHDRRPQGSR